MSQSTARERRQTAAAAPRKAPARVNVQDLTLDELDEVSQLVADGVCGRIVALGFVGLRARKPGLTLDEARRLTSRDVAVVDDDELGEGEPDPTTGPS